MYEFFIQKKEMAHFDPYNLKDVEKAFSSVQLVSFDEPKKCKVKDTELTFSAVPSGNSIGGTAWRIEYNKQVIYYAIDLNDKPTSITPPVSFDNFKGSNLMITNAYISASINENKKPAKIY
mmetsp:Transcript_16185/g.11402  ORF Transcript_16185/g.11402 Transcript_16185/m.11402 type:complete len:121 (-) Transcript_16185:956-1318(-)